MAAKVAAGTETGAAEAQTVGEFGDPDRRAADVSDRPAYLIGPTYFFDYRRLMIIVLSAVTPSVFGALLLVQAIAGADVWRAVLSALTVAITVAVQVGFWITVAFAVVERTSRGRRRRPSAWDPSDLPEVPTANVGLGETIFALLAYLLFIGLIVWQQNIWVVETAGGEGIPVLDPALWSFWLPWFIVLAVLEMAFALVLYATGHWTWALAWINVLLNLAFTVPAVALIATDQVLSAQFREAFAEVVPALEIFLRVIPFIIVGVAILDVVQGFRKAYRAVSPAVGS
ncbi:hypothetical protein [Microbacterium sulfonylureivorans]|uniref:hypothetical protein n=1 Tax=Microbacterium sulfonylureivorans TaxID=2486854 RepID=UPI0013DEBB8C|nr:hypothetical protein [Microbacterium sulfonylureivorans]